MTKTMSTSVSATEHVSREELDRIVGSQRRAFLAEGDPAAAVRRDRVERLLLAVLTYADALSDAADADFGQRPPALTKAIEVLAVVPDAEDMLANLETWMQPVVAEGPIPAIVQQKPLGVVGVMTAWNGPVMLSVQPALAALAAGNRVVIKSNELQPRGGAVLAAAVAEYFDPDELTVVQGDSATVAEFSKLQLDHLFFTGSPAVARIVAGNAAKNLVPVTLELGGKNPVLVDRSADIAEAARAVAGGRTMNGGQVCLCPDYAFVPREKGAEFVSELQGALLNLFPTTHNNPAVVSLVDDRNFERVISYIDDAVAKGATKIEAVTDEERDLLPSRERRVVAPTILVNVPDDAVIAENEIFGPVLPVYLYDEPEEVVNYINERPSPLGAYWFGSDDERFEQFLLTTTSGGVSRNDSMLHAMVPGLPFGGVGNSGTGAYHGKAGFDTFTHRRTVATQPGPGSATDPIAGGAVILPEFAQAADEQVASAIAAIKRRRGETSVQGS